MWVKFWARFRGSSEREVTRIEYGYSQETLNNEAMMLAEAREYVPSYMLDDGFYYGFEILEELPKEMRDDLVKKYRGMYNESKKMLKILGEDI